MKPVVVPKILFSAEVHLPFDVWRRSGAAYLRKLAKRLGMQRPAFVIATSAKDLRASLTALNVWLRVEWSSSLGGFALGIQELGLNKPPSPFRPSRWVKLTDLMKQDEFDRELERLKRLCT